MDSSPCPIALIFFLCITRYLAGTLVGRPSAQLNPPSTPPPSGRTSHVPIPTHNNNGGVMDDQEIAGRAIDLQNRAKEYGLIEIPGYMAWSERKLREGTSQVLIAHLDATGMCLL